MRIRASSGAAMGQPDPRPSKELEPFKRAILSAKTDADLITALALVKGEDDWEEQPDLYDWCDVLDRMDETLETAIHRHPSLLLIQPADHPQQQPEGSLPDGDGDVGSKDGGGVSDSSSTASELVLSCLKFLAVLMRNCVNKHVFSSSEHLRALLAAGDDEVAESALRCLMLLTLPPLLHRHQQPELPSMCSIHKDKVVSAELMTLSGGWGGRGQGLGLLACVTGRVEGEDEDGAKEGEASAASAPAPPTAEGESPSYQRKPKPVPVLPLHAGDLYFEYAPAAEEEETASEFAAAAAAGLTAATSGQGAGAQEREDGGQESNRAPSPGGYTGSRTIFVPATRLATASSTSPSQDDGKKKKEDGRGRNGTAEEALSSATLFRRLIKDHAAVPKRRLFSLLAKVRGAVAWRGGLEARRAAVRRRIMALTALVYCHPSEDALMAYISIQPELIQELVDLVRVRTDQSAEMTVPLDISVLAVHCLAALVHSRHEGPNLGLVARHTHVFQELGITRGQYTGLLPLLVRHGVASLFIMPEQDAAAAAAAAAAAGAAVGAGVGRGGRGEESKRDSGVVESKSSDPGDRKISTPTPPPRPEDAALSLGIAFVEAASAAPSEGRMVGRARGEEGVGAPAGTRPDIVPVSSATASDVLSSQMDQLRWVEAVFSLVWAVVSVQNGAAAMTECGLIPALLNVVQLNMDGQGFGGMSKPFHRRYVVSQAVQNMETAVLSNAAALSTFRELGAAEVLASAFSTEVGRLRDAGAELAASSAGDGDRGDGSSMVVDDAVDAKSTPAKAKGKKLSSTPSPSGKVAKGKGKGKGRDKGDEKGSDKTAAKGAEDGSAPAGGGGGGGDAASGSAPLSDPSPSQKALLFSLLSALSINFHNQTQSHQQVGADPLLEAFLTAAVMDVFRNSRMFGGVLVALTATLIADVANQDPSTTVAYLLRSGIVDEYLKVLNATPALPSSDFLVTVPNILHALCLTHDGASRVQEANVFPAFFRMLRSPESMHPQSRYPESNITIVGNGLDELMRHVPALRPQCIKALVASLKELVVKGNDLLKRELSGDSSAEALNERSLMQQYAANYGQLLETALGRPENAKPFVDAGGDEVLLSMFYSLAVPGPRPLLARATCAWGGGSGSSSQQ
ncbi:unnamed protein product, partial [Scytosiphon promiscuus]